MDLQRLRRDTPGCEAVLHLDHAGASLPPQCVLDAMVGHLELEARWGGYRAADHAAEALQDGYDAVAALLGCSSDEVAFVDSATRGWQLLFEAVPMGPGDRILCSRAEYVSNHLAFLQARERRGIVVVPIDSDPDGAIDLDHLDRELARGAALVALTHVPTQGGLVQPAAEVARRCRAAGVLLLLDACQSVGQVDVRGIDWDLLSATGRKYLRGPRGTGFLAVRREAMAHLATPLLDLHGASWTGPDTYTVRSDARRFEIWERPIAGLLGLRAAVRYALDLGIEALEDRIAHQATSLRTRLEALPGAQVHDQGRQRCGIVTFTVQGLEPAAVKRSLRAQDIHVSVVQRSSSLLDLSDRGLHSLVRASVHALTTDAELDRFLAALEREQTC